MEDNKDKKAVTTVPAQQPTTLAGMLATDRVKARFAEMMGKKSASFISSIISATKANAELAKCEPESIISSAVIAATLDLPIQSSLGFAAMVPYDQNVKQPDGSWAKKKVAQFQIMWRGFVQLAIRTGQYQNIHVSEVYEGELVSHNRITGEVFIDPNLKKSDTVIGYVGYFRLISGFEKYLYWTREECSAHGKKYSRSFETEKGRWKLDFDAMAKKTVIKMLLSKFGILSVEMQNAITTDQSVVVDPETLEVKYTDSPEDEEYREYVADESKSAGEGQLQTLLGKEAKNEAKPEEKKK